MSGSTVTDRLPASSDSSLPTFAALAMVAWLVCEFALRRGLDAPLAAVVGSDAAADALVMIVAIPLVAGAIAWWGTRNGIDPADWEYDPSLRAVGAGSGGVVVYYLAYLGLLAVLVTAFGYQLPTGAGSQGGAGAPRWALALFLLGNGVVVPIAEELAWRGVVQTALTESYGVRIAVVVTALAFVAKHLVVDLSAPLFRVTSLAVLAFVLGGLRARYGTASSTVAHVVGNLLATATLLFV